MAKFIESTEQSEIKWKWDDIIHINKPINIDTITTFKKAFHNSQRECIVFITMNGKEHTWVYLNEEDRDLDYDKILNI